MSPEMEFAVFIDSTLQRYARSGAFRAMLLAESPDAPPSDKWICPPSHRHAETATCYGSHQCRCGPCREATSDRNRYQRKRRAMAAWNQGKRTA